ncbi:MAG: hypothetical protein HYS71_02550 [Candidatus Omnitrophica bacterium]|nr:hypothetical protein [Candidatus Omnitrophota bacterium]
MRQGLQKKKFELAKGAYLELDGYTEKPLIFCESWAHIGEVKSAQQAKVMQDAVRLVYARKLTGRNARCILLFGDDVAANHFRGKKWVAWCLRALDIEVRVVHLPNSLRQKVLKAQERQYR